MQDANSVIIPRAGDGVAEFPIQHYAWTGTTGPRAWGALCHDDDGILVRLCAYEQPLVARAIRDGENVFEDSCLELFIRPEMDARYLNFEINPLGVMIIGLGTGRADRVRMPELKAALAPVVTIEPAAGLWCAAYRLEYAMLRQVYGAPLGRDFRLNLYKCGGTDNHFGMWMPVEVPAPDFHRPEYFGRVRLG